MIPVDTYPPSSSVLSSVVTRVLTPQVLLRTPSLSSTTPITPLLDPLLYPVTLLSGALPRPVFFAYPRHEVSTGRVLETGLLPV